jgi:hypothetical protein
VVVLVTVSGMTLSRWLLVPLHLSAFFVAAVMCHGQLAADRPSPARLTGYYLLIALGGAPARTVERLDVALPLALGASRPDSCSAIVGLGAGSLCAYARDGEEWVADEIDPTVERIARDPRDFTFWRDCRAQRRSVVRGDARLRLADAADHRYGMLVVDAFSSHAIAVHLRTRERSTSTGARRSPPGGPSSTSRAST